MSILKPIMAIILEDDTQTGEPCKSSVWLEIASSTFKGCKLQILVPLLDAIAPVMNGSKADPT